MRFDYYRINASAKDIPDGAVLDGAGVKFLLGNLSDFIKIYKDKNENIFHIKIFDKVFKIEKRSFDNVLKPKELFYGENENDDNSIDDYRYTYALFSNQKSIYNKDNETKDLISRAIRGSKTLKSNKNNFINNENLEFLCSTNGFYSDCSNYNQRINFIIIFTLALFYVKNTRDFIHKASNYKNKEELVNIRKDILDFDVRYFFANPVLQSRHELYEIYKLISHILHIDELYYEAKEQVKDMAKNPRIRIRSRKTPSQ